MSENLSLQKENEELKKKITSLTSHIEELKEDMKLFSYSISHDLVAPLRAINGFSEILEEDYSTTLDDEGKHCIKVIQENVEIMSSHIQGLVDYSRTANKELLIEEINTTKLVEKIIHEIQPPNGVNYHFNSENLHPISGDIDQIKRVFVNLLSNAIKFSSKVTSPSIVIKSEKRESVILFSITDNGVGIDLKYASTLFGVFQRFNTDVDFIGRGVGLAITKKIILKHGGKIWAESELGKGACFYFTLPNNQTLQK